MLGPQRFQHFGLRHPPTTPVVVELARRRGALPRAGVDDDGVGGAPHRRETVDDVRPAGFDAGEVALPVVGEMSVPVDERRGPGVGQLLKVTDEHAVA